MQNWLWKIWTYLKGDRPTTGICYTDYTTIEVGNTAAYVARRKKVSRCLRGTAH